MIESYHQIMDAEEFPLHWQMTPCERFALRGILESRRPKLAVEIGTYKGGSLQVLAKYAREVISVDLDPLVGSSLKEKFPNVSFRSGDSLETIPKLVKELNDTGAPVEFVLIDGDHSSNGVQRDIEAILQLKPLKDIAILMHDSFNPHCRQGMLSVNWQEFDHVKFVELDLIPGIYHYNGYDTAEPRSMWGGFAFALVTKEVRAERLVVRQSQGALHETVRRNSRYRFEGRSRLGAMIERAWERITTGSGQKQPGQCNVTSAICKLR